MNKMKISVVIPARNEEDNIPVITKLLLKNFDKYILEIIIVNDCSSDNTKKILETLKKENKKIKPIHRTRNPGVGNAIRLGYKNVSKKTDYVLSIDCDFVKNIKDIKKMIKIAGQNKYDLIYGSRYMKGGKLVNYPSIKKIANRTFHFLARIAFGFGQKDVTNNFKLFKIKVLDEISPLLKSSGFSVNAETGLYPIVLGYKSTEVSVSWIGRSKDMGVSHFRVLKAGPGYAGVLWAIFKFKFFSKKARLPVKNGGLLVVIGLFLAAVVVMLPFREVGSLDDFAYYVSVKNLAVDGVLKLSQWTQTSLIFQVYWGTLFGKIFGLSYKTLHLSSVVLFLVGLAAFYQTLRELGVNQIRSIFFSFLMFTFPTLFQYIFSFMAVTPYMGVLFVSIYFCVKAIKYDKTRDIILAAIFSLFSYLTRQIGIASVFALLSIFIVKSISYRKIYFKQLLICMIIGFGAIYFYEHWVHLGNNMTTTQYLKTYIALDSMKKAFTGITNYAQLRLTDEAYMWTLYKIGHFSNYIFGILILPFLSFFVFRPTQLFRLFRKNWKKVFLGFAILAFFYYLLYLKEKSRGFIYGILTETPRILYDPYTGWNDWRRIWDILVLIGLPFYSLFLGMTLNFLKEKFLLIRKYFKYRFFFIGTFIALCSYIMFFLKGFYLYRFDFVKSISFSIVLFGIFEILLFIFCRFQFKVKFKVSISSLMFLFVVLFTLLHLSLTSLGFHYWQEYILPLMPSYILLFALLFQEIKISLLPAFVVVLILFLLTFSFTRNTYQKYGISWELNEEVVNKAHIDPRNAGVSNFAWIPYFFSEEAYSKQLIPLNYDKSQISDLKPWSAPEYNLKEQKIFVYNESCSTANKEVQQKPYIEYTEYDLFGKHTYCVKIKQ